MTEEQFYRAAYLAPAYARKVIPAEGFNGMPSRSLQVLAAVNDLGAPSVKELATALVYRHPTVSVAVDNLLHLGHIELVATRDRRERRVCIRAKGRKLLRELYEHQTAEVSPRR